MGKPWTASTPRATYPGELDGTFDPRRHPWICSRRQMCLATLGAWSTGWCRGAWSQTDEPEPQPEPDDRREAKQRLESMRTRARATRLAEVEGGKAGPAARLRPEPLLRYNDPPRGIQDASLWAWGERGRPIAILKVERWTSRRPASRWGYGVVSLATGLVALEYGDGLSWNSRKPGWTPQPLAGAPRPASAAPPRLVQMKTLARRFSVTVHSVHNPNPLQLRLMPTPIDRYDDATSGVLDGALFAFSFGTNPTVFLVLEAAGADQANPSWRYGFARQGSGEMSARLDETEVWTQPFALASDDSETYTSRTMPETADGR